MEKEEPNRPTSRRQIARLLGGAGLPMYVLDENDVIVFVNDALTQLTHASTDDLLGMDCSDNRVHLLDDLQSIHLKELSHSLALPVDWKRNSIRLTEFAAGVTRVMIPLHSQAEASRGGSVNGPVLLILAPDSAQDIIARLSPQYAVGASVDAPINEFQHPNSAASVINHGWVTAGKSLRAQALRAQIKIAAVTSSAVCIVGPRCEERESIASRIQTGGQKRSMLNSFMRIDCNLLDGSLVDSLLGAIDEAAAQFSATRTKNDGSQFAVHLARLDEIPRDQLLSLDRYFSQREEIRLLASMTRPMSDLVASESDSSASLWDRMRLRISHSIIDLAPLSMRLEDLDALIAAWFTDHLSRSKGELRDKSVQLQKNYEITAKARDAIYAYHWPGSYQELAEVLSTALDKSGDGEIDFAHLPISVRTAPSHFNRPEKIQPIDLDKTLEEFEKQLIERALKLNEGNRSAASKMLGISRARIIRKLQQWEAVNAESDPVINPPSVKPRATPDRNKGSEDRDVTEPSDVPTTAELQEEDDDMPNFEEII